MNSPYHYEVRLTGVRYNSKDDLDFKEKIKEFRDEDPLISRKRSLEYYEDYISNILIHLGYSYTSDRESRRILDPLFDKGSSKKVPIKDFDDDISEVLFFGIGVFFVIDKKVENTEFKVTDDLTGEEQHFDFGSLFREQIIHGIGYHGYNHKTDPEHLILGLYFETQEYQNDGFDLNGLTKTVEFYEYDINDSDYNEILPTPFDWSGFDVPWKEEIEEEIEPKEILRTYNFEPIIKEGESDQVEFKSSLIYNFKTNVSDNLIRSIIGKTICGFLNSRGGLLFVGVTDDGKSQGLSYDFSLSGSKKPKDFFLLQFDQLLETYLPQWVQDFITVGFIEIEGVEIFVVLVKPSKKEPVFLKGQKGKEFYIRRTGSTKQLDVEDFLYYWKSHWG